MERQELISQLTTRWRSIVTLLCLISLFASGLAHAIDSITIVSIPENQAHQKFSEAFQRKLINLFPNFDIFEYSVDEYEVSDSDSLLVTLGSRALEKTAGEQGVIILHTLVSESFYKNHYPENNKGIYRLVFDHPPERILRLQSIALPESKYIGVLIGHQNPEFFDKLTRAVRKSGKQLVTEKIGPEFSESLSNLLSQSDSLLLFPDSTVINRSTINTLVLDSYHKKIPLLGYSKALVMAGALVALYSTPEQLGEDAAEIANRIISGKKVSRHNYPRQFEISVNYKLSRVYGLSIPSENELHKMVMEGERR